METELEKFRMAIYRYKHLMKGGTIDLEQTLKIEEIQQEIMAKLERYYTSYFNQDLEHVLNRFYEEGILEELIKEAAAKLGEDIIDAKTAYTAFLTGDMEITGAKSAFVVVQAIARVKAKLFEKTRGNIESTSGRCPLCGAESSTMLQESSGYYMLCPFCGYKWKISATKLTCPYCGNSDPLSIGLFTGKKERRLGLVWCQKCGKTWRIILDEKIINNVPRILLPVISFGAEIYRGSILDDRAQEPEKSSESTGLEPRKEDS